jgi:uncharacterized protein YigA (DUF484 family)
MIERLEESEFAAEVGQLLATAALGDATDAQIARLNDLLLQDASLRDQAARFFEEEAVLRREFQVLDRVVDFHTPLRDVHATQAVRNGRDASCEATECGVGLRRMFLAVAVLICASLAALWLAHRVRSAALDPASETGIVALQINDRSLPLTASILTPVTYVSWSGPRFATDINARPLTTTMREGTTAFTSAFGRPAQGYMVCLQPDSLLDLIVTADADGENALAVIEFDESGRPTGRRISFSNSAGEDDPDPAGSGKFSTMTKKGRLGIWTERNDGARPRYYLFTGVHKLLNRSADDSWHVSRLLAFVTEPGLFHIGWDDSGMLSSSEQDYLHVPDDDFDDVSATIRIRKLKPEQNRPANGVHVYSITKLSDAELGNTVVDEVVGHSFSVPAGKVAIVKACSRSGRPVEVTVIEKESHKLQWQCSKDNSRSPTLGICAIENKTTEPCEFYLVGREKMAAASASVVTRVLSPSMLFEKEELVTVGFDNGTKDSDFNRLKVDILTMGDL